MKNEILRALRDLIAGPFLGLHRAAVYRALELRADTGVVSDTIGAAARLLALLAAFLPLSAPVVLGSLAVVGWAAIVAAVEIAVALCGRRYT